ncbi:MAG: SIMPL domain-containing protein [Defluviitaleaceae bacterium]|nr:SIMPL domain-containing protein [Defluviitaleaceae bacterium]
MKKLLLTVLSTVALTATAYGSISVTGTGTINAEADIAIISMGVRIQDENVSTALTHSTELMNSISEVLEALGVSQITTSNFNIWETWDFSHETGESIMVHQVSNNLDVLVDDFSIINEVIESSVNAGATDIWIRFQSSNVEYYRERALELAITNANRRASIIANALNRPLGAILSVSTDDGFFVDPIPLISPRVEQDIALAANHIVHPGQVTISQIVRITFE